MVKINKQNPITSMLGGGGTVRKIWRPRDPQGKYDRGTKGPDEAVGREAGTWKVDRRAKGEGSRIGTQPSQLSATGGWHWQPDSILAREDSMGKRPGVKYVFHLGNSVGEARRCRCGKGWQMLDHGRPPGFGLCWWVRRAERGPAVRSPCVLLWSQSG